MRVARYIALPAVVALAVVGSAAASSSSSAHESRPAAVSTARYDAEVARANFVYDAEVQHYFDVEHFLEVAAFDEAVAEAQAEAQAEAAAAASHPQGCNAPNCPHKAPPPPSHGPTMVTGACGGATNGADAFIGRESGGNPNAQNPSGAWGCYQIMPGTWSSSCNDLGPEHSASPQTQAQCASRLPTSSWAASGPT